MPNIDDQIREINITIPCGETPADRREEDGSGDILLSSQELF
jgi:hypothetical protein